MKYHPLLDTTVVRLRQGASTASSTRLCHCFLSKLPDVLLSNRVLEHSSHLNAFQCPRVERSVWEAGILLEILLKLIDLRKNLVINVK